MCCYIQILNKTKDKFGIIICMVAFLIFSLVWFCFSDMVSCHFDMLFVYTWRVNVLDLWLWETFSLSVYPNVLCCSLSFGIYLVIITVLMSSLIRTLRQYIIRYEREREGEGTGAKRKKNMGSCCRCFILFLIFYTSYSWIKQMLCVKCVQTAKHFLVFF